MASLSISSLALIGSSTLADTAVPGVFGGLSGITYDEASNTYQLISDAGNRLFTVQLAINAAGNSVTPTHFNGTETSTPLNITGGFAVPDTEGLARTRNGTFLVSSEGAYAGGTPLALDNYTLTENPFIKQFNASGTELLSLTLPSRYTTSTTTTGPRINLALESLTLTPNDQYLFTAVEAPLKQDQSLAALAVGGALNRIVRFDLSGGIVANPSSQEFLYITDTRFGLSELLALDNSGQRLLAIERAANATTGALTGVKVYELNLTGATDISGNAGLNGVTAGITAATKTPLADFSVPALAGLLANYEGMTFGPLLPDGRRSLVLVSDNNGTGATRFTAFAIDEAPILVTIAATDANAAEAGQNSGTFRISRTGGTTNSLTVNYTIATGAGQATSGDYTPTLTGSVVIPIGQSFVDVTLTPVDDALVETGGETVTLNLTDAAIYDLGATATATVTIADNDVAVPILLNGPSGSPDAIGATNTNDDFTNLSSNVPANLAPGDIFNPNAVTFTNTVRNTGGAAANVALLPTPPANANDLPPGTVVTISANGGATTATYTYGNGVFQFVSATGFAGGNPISPTNPVQIEGIAANGTANYTVTVDLPTGTPLSTDASVQRGFPVAITAFIDSNGNGLADDAATNRTINRVYTGFLQLVTQTRILQGTGPAVQGVNGTLSTTLKTPAPGNIIEYVTEYRNISEGQPANGSGNGILTASNVVITQDGIFGANNWAEDNPLGNGILDTSHVANSAQSLGGTLAFFSGNPGTTPATNATSGTTAATDVTRYVNTLANSITPGASGTFIVQRSVNTGGGGTTLTNITTATYENPNNPNVPINGTTNPVDAAIASLPTVNLSVSATTGTEVGTTVITVTATASAAVSGNQAVTVGVSGTGITTGDYSLSNGTLTIANGQTTGSVTFTVVDDALVEGTETATLTISNPSSGLVLGNTISQTIAITDNDTAGITITPSGGTTAITEGGATDTYTVVLNSQPTADVTIAIANGSETRTNVPSLIFTAANWNVAQTVILTAVDDATTEGNHQGTITHSVSSADGKYNGIPIASVTAAITDNDTPPTTGNASVTLNEDAVYTFSRNNFAFADADAGNTLQGIRITQRPTVGQLFLDANGNNLQDSGEAITANQDIAVAALSQLKFKPAANANGTSYTSLQFRVSDGQFLSTAPGTFTFNVAPINDLPTGAVTISGTATQGQTLTASNSLADVDGLGPITYQWQAGGTDITGATGTTLLLTQAQVGKAITALARYTDGFGTPEAVVSVPTSLVTATVPPVTPPSVTPPSVTPPPVTPPVTPLPVTPPPTPTPPQITPLANQLLAITGDSPTRLTATVTVQGASSVLDIVVVVVDDGEGRINGLLPSTAGYGAAAVARASTLMSVLKSGDFAGQFGRRSLPIAPGQFLQFALSQGGTLDDLKRGGAGQLFFATANANANGQSIVQYRALTQGYAATFSLPGATAPTITLQLSLEATATTVGSQQQGTLSQSELLDLTGMAGPTATLTMSVFREAFYNNIVGLYTVQNAQGQVRDPLTGGLINPGEAGYLQAALANRVVSNLAGQNGQTLTYTANVATGQLLSTFLVVNGTLEALLDSNPTNDPTVFFNYMAANGDGQDHVRLLGDNVFGYEDIVGGGDRDFNDVIVKVAVA